MNETSFTFIPGRVRQNLPNRVSTKYHAARALVTLRESSRAAIAMQRFKASQCLRISPFSRISQGLRSSRSRVPIQSQTGVNTTPDLLKDSFRTCLPLPTLLDRGFEEALRHVLSTPGSMVRPRMVLSLGTAYSLSPEAAFNVAIALEYFHTASLIFDDLPC